jgi:hypothetical protein
MRLTRSSATLEIARRRLERLKSITPIPDFGVGFTISDYETEINNLALLEATYNTTVSSLDAQLSEMKFKERALRDLRERMLSSIAFLYGKDSDEYVAAGGIRKSERKRPRAKMSSSTPSVEN